MSARVRGEVYRTRDTKLNRQVALKILPEAFASDPDRLARLPAGSASSRQLQSSWHHRDLSKGSCGR